MSGQTGIGTSTLKESSVSSSDTPLRVHRGSHRAVAMTGVLIYGLGMLAGMLWSAISSGEWWIALLFLPQALLAMAFGPGSMAMALLAPDPYVVEPGQKPAELPDFN